MRNILTVLFLILVVNSCKISYSFTGASISPDVKTFSVDYINNVASIVEPSLSNTMTEGLKDKFLTETSLRIVNSGGDLQIEGKIIKYEQTYTGVKSNETAASNRLSITVRIVFTNIIEPKKSYEESFTSYYDYDSSKSLDEVEEDAIKTITTEIIDKIFLKSVADW